MRHRGKGEVVDDSTIVTCSTKVMNLGWSGRKTCGDGDPSLRWLRGEWWCCGG